MSEVVPMVPSRDEAAAPVASGQSAGALLRSAREASGLHVAALAVALKVPVKKLEALEADRFDLLPDVVFVRALASSVCRSLKLDPGPILEKLPQSIAPRLDAETRGINTPFRAREDAKSWTIPEALSKPLVLVVGALLVLTLAVAFFPSAGVDASKSVSVGSGRNEDAGVTESSRAPAVAVEVIPSAAPVAAASAVAATPANVVASAPAKAESAPAVAPSAAKPASAPAALASATVAPKQADQKVVEGVGDAVLVFRARATCWVQVTDSKGVVQVNKTMAAGEVLPVSALGPLSVVIGRVDAMAVDVRGKPYNLGDVAKENVARFEVR